MEKDTDRSLNLTLSAYCRFAVKELICMLIKKIFSADKIIAGIGNSE